MTEEEALAEPGLLFRHFKGGIYRYCAIAKSADDDQQLLVIYEHLYPHERQLWIRRLEEFFGYKDGAPRFAPISNICGVMFDKNPKVMCLGRAGHEGFHGNLPSEPPDIRVTVTTHEGHVVPVVHYDKSNPARATLPNEPETMVGDRYK